MTDTVQAALREAADRLAQVSDTARLDAELLMAHALGMSRSAMLLNARDVPVPAGFAPLVERRRSSEPVAYIIGEQDFCDLTLRVSPAVLIPRADSETVVDAALAACAAPRRVLDCGTGSGALLLAVLHARPQAQGVGIDVSPAAIAVARENAERSGLGQRTRLIEADWGQAGWADGLGRFDCILANPPYVEDDASLDPDVHDYEPHGALFAGAEGLDAYRQLVPQLPDLLDDAGVAVLEIGHRQADAVTRIAADAGFCATLTRDLAGRPRALTLRKA